MGEYYRLSKDVVPLHYDLYLEPDLKQCTFKGRVEIDLDIKGSIEELVVNAHAFTDLSILRLIKLGNTKIDINRASEDTKRKSNYELEPVEKLVQVQEYTDSTKRRRDEEDENVPEIVAKKSKPCPGRYRTKSVSDNSDNDSETSANDTSERDDTTKEDVVEKEDDGQKEDDAKKEGTDKVEAVNDNVKASSSGGLLLLRSEWAGPSGDESSEGEEEYAQQRFVEDDPKEESEEENEEEEENYGDTYGASDNSDNESQESDKLEEGGYVLSSDDEDDRGTDDVCYVGDEDDDSDDVMQVDGAFDRMIVDGNSSNSSSSDNDDDQDQSVDDLTAAEAAEEAAIEAAIEAAAGEAVSEDDEEIPEEDEELVSREAILENTEDSTEQETLPKNDLVGEESKPLNLQLESDIEESDAINEVLDEVKDHTDKEDGVQKETTVGDVFEALQAEEEADIDNNDEGSNQDTMEVPEEQEILSEHETIEAENINTEVPDEELKVSSIKFLRDQQVVCIKAANTIVPGRYRLAIQFAGDLDDSLRGFYRTKHTVNGEAAWGAACHFEATGARKCFPCMDQPEFRSTFDISVKRPNQHVEVLSNMPCCDETEDVIKFSRTPAMPTYLICLVIGYYDNISRRTESGVKVSAYTQTGQIIQAIYALDVATRALKFYQDFFQVNYTLPKIDLVAVPDFYIGAMENWGLLTFRETDLLFHPQQSTLSRRQYVAILVCHEIAHQWFGNLVSIAWWDQTWLKEGFATWISYLAVDHLFPEFDIWSDFLTTEMMVALRLDSLDSSHPIQVEVQDPCQIDEIFDVISYNKGASIINMLFNWIGKSAFQTGMNTYLSEHSNSSARTADLWRALETGLTSSFADTTSNTDNVPSVEDVMDQWTTLQGYPTLNVRLEDCGSRTLVIKQSSRFQHTWKVPVKLPGDQIALIGADEYSVNMEPGSTGFPLVNSGQSSFCRVNYDWESILKPHLADIQFLESRDKAGILSSLALNFMRTGLDNKLHLLEVVGHYAGEVDWVVVDTLLSVLDDIESLVMETQAWAGYLQLAYSILLPILEKVGWEEEKLSGNITFTQGAVIQRLGKLGHSDTCGESSLLWQREERGGQPLGKSIRPAVYRTVASRGGHREMNYFLDLYRRVQRNEEKRMLLTVLGSFTNTDIMQQMLEWSMSDEVKLQDRVFLICCIADTGLEGRCAAFKFFQDNFPELSKQYTSGSLLKRLIKGVIKHFNTTEDLDKIQLYFQEHNVPGAQRTIEQCCEDIRLLVVARDTSQDEVLRYLNARFPPPTNGELNLTPRTSQYKRRSFNTSFDKATQRVL